MQMGKLEVDRCIHGLLLGPYFKTSLRSDEFGNAQVR